MADKIGYEEYANYVLGNPGQVSSELGLFSAEGDAYQLNTLLQDGSSSSLDKAYGVLNSRLSPETKDNLASYFLNDDLSQKAFNRELQASSTQYQRTVEDLRKAGLNPYLALDNLRAASASSSAGNVSGGMHTQRANSKAENQTSLAKAITTVLGILAASMISLGGK